MNEQQRTINVFWMLRSVRKLLFCD